MYSMPNVIASEARQSTTIYLVRHCDYKIINDLVARHLPGVGLSTTGKNQAQKLSQYFKSKHIQAIYTSPLLRTRQTAQAIAQAVNKRPKNNSLLIEVKSPIKKITHQELTLYDFIYDHPKHSPKGETRQEVYERMQKYTNLMLKKHPGENIIAVSHGDPIMLLVYGLVDQNLDFHAQKTRPYIPKGGMFRLIFRGNRLDSCEQMFSLIS